MSRHEWEEGTIRIPVADWPRFRSAVIRAWNNHQDDLLRRAKSARQAALKAGYRKRGFDRAEWVRERHWSVAHLITKPGSDKVYVPKKKDLRRLPIHRGADLSLGDGARITLDDVSRGATWIVSENNHACERARNHPVAKVFFSELHKIRNWTKGSGGNICGNDEYNRENRDFDGGANYIVSRFGPDKETPIFDGSYLSHRSW